MINQKDYLNITRTYALRIGMDVEDVRDEFPVDDYDLYDELESDLRVYEQIKKSDPEYEGEDLPCLYNPGAFCTVGFYKCKENGFCPHM